LKRLSHFHSLLLGRAAPNAKLNVRAQSVVKAFLLYFTGRAKFLGCDRLVKLMRFWKKEIYRLRLQLASCSLGPVSFLSALHCFPSNMGLFVVLIILAGISEHCKSCATLWSYPHSPDGLGELQTCIKPVVNPILTPTQDIKLVAFGPPF